MKVIEGNIVDIINRCIYPGKVLIQDGVIQSLERTTKEYRHYVLPGFIDAHVHIESSMMTPKNFLSYVGTQGTVAIVTDPHEIGNVLGEEGIDYMVNSATEGTIKCFFTIPSCIPATPYDSSGAEINAAGVERLFETGRFVGLSEMMNVPGVLYNDKEVMLKINSALSRNLPIDGHAPLLAGDDLKKYIGAGISTDHESLYYDEAKEKILDGMKIQIREGSSAKDYQNLKRLIADYPNDLMFSTDDSHPDDLLHKGHINHIVRMAIADGFDLYDVLRIASRNAIEHYHLPVGMLREGDPADFIVVKDLESFEVLSTYINGEEVYGKDKKEEYTNVIADVKTPNKFVADLIDSSQLALPVNDSLMTIGVKDGDLTTECLHFEMLFPTNNFECDLSRDILKIVYYNRYHKSVPQMATIHGFGLKKGAIASSISHDSHNIIAVGCSDDELTKAINRLIENKGGIVVVDGDEINELALPVAGIMCEYNCQELAELWETLLQKAQEMGTLLSSPFMTLAFMSLIVIPSLKIGEKGLFDYHRFSFINK